VLHENRKRIRIHENLFTVGKRTSPHVYSTSTCLLYFHMSILLPHVYSTSTFIFYFHVSTLSAYVYSTSTCRPHTAAALRLSVRITSDESKFWCLDIFLLRDCVYVRLLCYHLRHILRSINMGESLPRITNVRACTFLIFMYQNTQAKILETLCDRLASD